MKRARSPQSPGGRLVKGSTAGEFGHSSVINLMEFISQTLGAIAIVCRTPLLQGLRMRTHKVNRGKMGHGKRMG